MLRTVIWFIYFWIYLFLKLPLMFSASKKSKEEQNQIATNISKSWAKKLLRLAGCTSSVSGLENIPKDKAVLFVSNHQGNFDIPLMIAHLNKPFGFIAKDDLAKLPLINRWMTMLKCIFITRNNPREAIKAISSGIKTLKNNHSLLVFPEGTRSRDGHLLPFKPGSLKLATKSGVPIIPITISGSINLMKKEKWIIQPAHVNITIHAPIEMTEEYIKDTTSLAKKLSDTVKSAL